MLPSGAVVIAWVLFVYVLLYGIRYLLGARIYLTCALREVENRSIPRQQIEPEELRLLGLLDDELLAAGFRHLGFGAATPLLTYYAEPLKFSVFVNERLPAYALVREPVAPEYGNLVALEIGTVYAAGDRLITLNTLFSEPFFADNMRVEAYEGLSVAGMVERHAARVAAERTSPMSRGHVTLEDILGLAAASLAGLRVKFRRRNWVAPTTDPKLDRFTLRGAFALTHYSRRVFGARKIAPKNSLSGPSENERLLRIEADLRAVLRIAENPQPAPGTPWPLIMVIGASGVLSFIAMALLWNAAVAAVILAAITFHEAGHALAMRRFGYRDVHIFFVPLLGAMTVGSPATTTVRDRLAVLLAGPVPGLWLGVALLAIDQSYGPVRLLRMSALALLILNGLNLLPFTPLDGGRALEALTRPESVWRLVVHAASAVGLLALAAFSRDPVIAAIGLLWAVLFPRQLLGYRLRRAVAAGIRDRADSRGVMRVTLETLSVAPFAKYRAAVRQATARAFVRLFSESLATAADRRWGAIAYVSAWIPVAAAVLLWIR
jgi:Zn-dependent protease